MPRALNARNAACTVMACVLVAACASGGGGGGGSYPQVQPQQATAPQPQQPASIDTGIIGTVGSPAHASFGATSVLATPGGQTFNASGGSDSFPLTLSSLQGTYSDLAAVSPNQGATATFSTSGPFTNLRLDIPAANVHVDINMLTSVVAGGALLNHSGTGDWPTAGLSYVLMGEWSQETGRWSNDGVLTLSVSSFVFGYETPVAAMPTTGTATFSGLVNGTVLKPVGGTISATPIWGGATFSTNFSSGQITGAFSNMRQPSGTGGFLPWNDVSVSASIAAATNRFSGSTAATSTPNTTMGLSTSATGHIDGAFYGPNAENLGAIWSLSDGVGSALGAITAGR